MSGPFGSSQFMYATGAAEEGQSLRFEDGDVAYLSFTPASAGNRKTWTWSGWVKRGDIDTGYSTFWSAGVNAAARAEYGFQSDNLYLGLNPTGSSWNYVRTNAVFRDHSAWYHMVFAVDMTQSTSTDRVKCWVNGIAQTFSSYAVPAQNTDLPFNNNVAHYVGSYLSGAQPFDGYLANVAFIDGTALDPTSFGEYDGTLWKPKSDADITSLTFGTNGFYLPFKQTTEAEGFSTVTYTGTSSQQAIEGVGFEPDLVWLKARSSTGYDHVLQDSVRGSTKQLYSNSSSAEVDDTDAVTSFDSSGFTTGADVTTNNSGVNYVAWCWDAGSGSAVSNTDGSITSSVKANTAKGFSISTYTGNATDGATIGHGLSQSPDMIIVKDRTNSASWRVMHKDISYASNTLYLDATYGETADDRVKAVSSTTFTVTGGGGVNGSARDHVVYCFHSVSGYSSIGSYSGTGSSGNSITGLGFKPAWLMIKRTDNTGNWWILDNTRDVIDDDIESVLLADSSGAEFSTGTGWPGIDFTSDGFDLNATAGGVNASGGTYIYMAFADTRDATFFGDTSGNSNNWTPNALNNTDVLLDSPVTGGNFAVLNAVVPSSNGLSEGNLKQTGAGSGTADEPKLGSVGMSSGKWYWEYAVTTSSDAPGNNSFAVGVATSSETDTNPSSTATSNRWAYRANFSAGDIVSVAYDADAQKLWVALNNTWISSGNPAAGTNQYHDITVDTVLPYSWLRDTPVWVLNFGQDSSFAGNETPQGNTDDNGVGDFYYAPPSGFLALTTGNLPTPTITAPDDYFNTVLYTGTGATRSVTGVGFQPDWVWIKQRSGATFHNVYDALRIVSSDHKRLYPNATNAEESSTYLGTTNLTSFDSDGFSVGNGADTNNNTSTYVAWNWLAGNSTSSNTDGSITSTVSANTDAGFSIVNYTGDGGTGETSVGHGLSQTPELIIYKNRDTTGSWPVTYTVVDGSNDFMYLNSTVAAGNATQTLPTSSVFYIQSSAVQRNSGQNYIQYCFHSVEGYSKIGSYTGNGSTDGTFVHCGFRPSWILVKSTSGSTQWMIYDNKREGYNVDNDALTADDTATEKTDNDVDFLSNGFKWRRSSPNFNQSTYIFYAVAEAPFSKANAR